MGLQFGNQSVSYHLSSESIPCGEQRDSAPDSIIEDSHHDAEEAPLQRQSSGSRDGAPLKEIDRERCCVIL